MEARDGPREHFTRQDIRKEIIAGNSRFITRFERAATLYRVLNWRVTLFRGNARLLGPRVKYLILIPETPLVLEQSSILFERHALEKRAGSQAVPAIGI